VRLVEVGWGGRWYVVGASVSGRHWYFGGRWGKEAGWLVEGRFWFGDVRKGWR
jgi:hypothetical protein